MNRCGTAPRPLFASLARQEGVVVVDDLVFGASAGGGRLAQPVGRRCGSVTVQGDEWSLVSLGTIADLGLRHARQNLPAFRRYLRSELTRAGPPARDGLDSSWNGGGRWPTSFGTPPTGFPFRRNRWCLPPLVPRRKPSTPAQELCDAATSCT